MEGVDSHKSDGHSGEAGGLHLLLQLWATILGTVRPIEDLIEVRCMV